MKTTKLFIILIISFASHGAFAEEIKDCNLIGIGNTNLAFDVYNKLKNTSNNVFFSPYSISTALVMTYAGARGETQKQMAEVLHFDLPKENLFPAFGFEQKKLIQAEKSHGYQFFLANALWVQEGEPFLDDFLELNQKYFKAKLTQLDFVTKTEKSRQIINSWIEKKTEDKIKDFIQSDGRTPDTVLVLSNAIYFKGQWQTKFKKTDTKKEDFLFQQIPKPKLI